MPDVDLVHVNKSVEHFVDAFLLKANAALSSGVSLGTFVSHIPYLCALDLSKLNMVQSTDQVIMAMTPVFKLEKGNCTSELLSRDWMSELLLFVLGSIELATRSEAALLFPSTTIL